MTLQSRPFCSSHIEMSVSKVAIERILFLVLCTALVSGCVARTAIKATGKVAGTTARTAVKTTGAIACTAADIVAQDPRCKG